jgi:hypothetical protein
MRSTRTNWALVAAASAVAVMLLSGCGAPTIQPPADTAGETSGHETSSATTEGDTEPSRGRDPDSGGGDSGDGGWGRTGSGRGGLSSPIRIPLPTNQVSGMRFAEAKSSLEAKIAEACGGNQCVGIVRVNDDYAGNDTREECDVIDRVRGGESDVVEVARGGDLVLEVRIRCEDVGGTGTDGTDGTDGTGTDGTDGTAGTDGTDGTGTDGTGTDGTDGASQTGSE